MTEYIPTPVEATLISNLDSCRRGYDNLRDALRDLYDEQTGTLLLGPKTGGWVKAMHRAEELLGHEHRTKPELADNVETHPLPPPN